MAPVSVSVPAPALVSASVALPFCRMPLNVVLVPSPPAVRVMLLAAELVMVPAPAIEPTLSENPARSSVPVMVTAEVSASTPAAPSASVPALIVVAPLWELAPESVSVPVPLLVKAPLPAMMPP